MVTESGVLVDESSGPATGTVTKDREFAAYMARRHAGALRTAYLLAGDHHVAEDIVQTAFAKLYLAWDRHAPELRDGYLRRILVNENNSWWRRPWHRREVTTDVLPEGRSPDPTDAGEQLWRLVLRLPRKQRAALVLRYYEELSEAETAAALGVSVGTVKSQTSRALAALRIHADDLREELS